MGGFIVLFAEWLIYIAIIAFGIIVNWKLFTKAGERGWKCLIPFYGTYIKYKIAHRPKLGIWGAYVLPALAYLLSFLLVIMLVVGFSAALDEDIQEVLVNQEYAAEDVATDEILPEDTDIDEIMTAAIGALLYSIVILLAMFALSIAQFIINIFLYIGLTKAFNMHWAFTIGLICMPIIFTAILAFDKDAVYQRQNNAPANTLN